MAITAQEAARRLADAGLSFGDRYQQGTSGKGSKWVGAATQAEQNYKSGVSEFLAKGSLAREMQSAGASAYDEGVRATGVENWGRGLQAKSDKYARNVQKFVPLWGAALTAPRGPRRSPANLKRMQENVERFAKAAV